MNERRLLLWLPACKFLLHLVLSPRYGWHRDELYFVECGRNLALGYVDHPPMVPWLAGLADMLVPDSLVGVRVFAALAGACTLALALMLTRALGGGLRAQLCAGLCVLLAPAYLRMSMMLNIVVFEQIYWTVATLLLVRLWRGGHPRLWLALGCVIGLSLLNKHTTLLWVAAACVSVLSTRTLRVQLATRWPWLGAGAALLLFAPNLYWQAAHDYPTWQFIQNMTDGTLAEISRARFLLGQVLNMHPLLAPAWLLGLVHLWRADGGRFRFLAWHYLTVLALLLITGSKPYYASACYVVLFAAGGVALERWLARARSGSTRRRVLLVGALAALPLSFVTLPILSVSQVNAIFDRLLLGTMSVRALNHDMHNQYGWPEQVDAVHQVYRSLPPGTRARTAILTGNYGQASAINVLGRGRQLPRARSGHMTYHLWGPGDSNADTLIVYGLSEEALARVCIDPQERRRADHPLADERQVPIYVCRASAPLDAHWRALKSYHHRKRVPYPP